MRIQIFLGFLAAFLGLGPVVSVQSQGEMRGIWISDPTVLKWEPVVKNIKAAGLNTLFVNFASAGVAFYPSRFLPHKPPVEPFTRLVKLAHRHGIEVHAKLLSFFMYWSPPAQVEKMKEEDRLLKNMKGELHLQAKTPWLDPGMRENREQVSNLVFEILEDFKVDGIQLDYIRFYEEHGIPPGVMQIRQSTLTNFVFDLGEQLKNSHPHIRFSACVFYSLDRARKEMGQDWQNWVDRNIFSFLVPMNYTTHVSELHKWITQQNQIRRGGTTFYSGLGAYMKSMTPETLWKQIQVTRNLGNPGFVLFSYSHKFLEEHLPFLKPKLLH